MNRSVSRWRGWLITIQAVLTLCATAQAQDTLDTPNRALLASPSSAPAPPGTFADPLEQLKAEQSAERPWAIGVNPEAQAKARQLFVEGTEYLLRSLEEQAIAKYEEALRHWEHPGIHYNYAVALSTRDRSLDTRRHLIEALRYGDQGPLDRFEVEQARRYLSLVEASLALIDVSTTQPGVTVRMNGQVLFTGPGRYHEYVEPDAYVVTASKPDYLTQERRISFLPGKENKLVLRLYSEQELTRYRRRWDVWGPVTVTTVGAIATLAGGAAWLVAANKFEEYDSKVNAACPFGCVADDSKVTSLESLKRSGERYNAAALPLMVGGGVTLAAGAVLLYLNRAEAYRIAPEEVRSVDRWSWVPVVGPSMGMLVGGSRF